MSGTVCAMCGDPIEQPATGRRRKWCSDQCRKTAAAQPDVGGDPPDLAIGPAVDLLLDELDLKQSDPRSVAGLLLRRLAAGVDADRGYNVGLAREVRQLLAFVADTDGLPGSGEVDESRVRFLRDRILASRQVTP